MTPSLDEYPNTPGAQRAISEFLNGPDEDQQGKNEISKFLNDPEEEQQPAPSLPLLDLSAPARPEAVPAMRFTLPQAYELARNRDPDRTARVMDLSVFLNSPADVVDRNLDKAEAAKAARENRPDFERLAVEAPATARHLANPQNMAVSKDDVDSLGAVERFVKGSDFLGGVWHGYLSSVRDVFFTPRDFSKILDDASRRVESGLVSLGVPESVARRGGAFEEAAKTWDAWGKEYEPPAWSVPTNFTGKLMSGIGRLPMDLGILSLAGRALPGGVMTAMGLQGAIRGGAEGGWEGATYGGVHGALFGGALQAFGTLPGLLQSPAAGAFAFGTTLYETGDMEEALAQGLLFAGFHAPQFVKGVSDIYAKSKTLARSPALAEAHAAKVFEEAGYPETSYLSARDVHAAFEPYLKTEGNSRLKKFLEPLGISLAEFDEAGRLDYDLTFPSAKMVWFNKSPEGKALLERVKWTPFADERLAQELLALRAQAEAGPQAEPGQTPPAEGRQDGQVLDLSAVVAGDAVVNPSDLLRQAGLNPAGVAQVLGPIADAPMPVADIVADQRFTAALKLLNYDGVKLGEAAAGPAAEPPVILTRKGGVYSENEALAKIEELGKQGIAARMAEMEGGYGLAVESVEQPNPAQVRQTIETAMALAVQNQKAPQEVIGIVEPDVARKIKEKTGTDALVYRHVIDPSFVSHVFMRHGVGNESLPGHRGVEPKDILRIPDVLLTPDDVQTGSRPGNVVFVKRVNGTIYYVESARPGSRTLEPRTMWIRDAKYFEGAETPASSDAPGTPEPRAERPKRLAGSEENIRPESGESKASADDMDVLWPDRAREGKEDPASTDAPGIPEPRPERPGRLAGRDTSIPLSDPADKAAAKDGPVKALADVLDPLQGRAENALPVEIALSASDISVPEVRQAALDNPNVKAVTLPGDRVIFITDRLGSPEEAVKLWVHEQGIHQGLRVLLGKDLDVWRDGLVKTYGGADGLREIAEAHGIDLSEPGGLRRAAEERFALIADKALLENALTPEDASLWQRFVQLFRDSLRRQGLAVEFTDQEIARLARDSLRATLGQERPAGGGGGNLRPRDVVELALAKETMGMERAFEDQDILALAAADPTLAAELREYDWLWGEAMRQAEARMDRLVARERAQDDKAWAAEAKELYELSGGWQAYKRIVESGGLSESSLRLFYDDAIISDLKRMANRYEGHKEGNRRQKLVVKENEYIGPDELARELGFTDGTQVDDLVKFLLAQPGRKDFVDQHVAARRMEQEGAYAAEEAVATDGYEQALEKQSEIFGKLLGKKPRGSSAIKTLIEEQTGVRPWRQAISESDALVASLKRQQDAARIAFKEGMQEGRAEARAQGRERLEAERRKGLEAAFEASERLRESVARVRERVRVKEETDKALQKVQKAVDGKTVDGEFSEHIRALAARFGLITAKSKMPKDPGGMRPLRELLLETLPPDSLVGMVVPEKFLDPNFRKNWKDMTFDELVEVGSILDALASIGRKKNHALSYQSKLTFDQITEMSARFTADNKKRVAPEDPGHYVIPDRSDESVPTKTWAMLLQLETVLRAADGWKEGAHGEGPFGPNVEFGLMPLARGAERELKLWEEFNAGYKELLEPIRGDMGWEFYNKRHAVTDVPFLITREQMVMVALNCGNEGNLRTVREGMRLTDAQIKKITDQLTREEWNFVTGVWALHERLRPHLDAVYRSIYGRPMGMVAPTPWETPYGTVAGGYMPIVADPRRSTKGEMYSDLEDQKFFADNSWQPIYPSNSMTKGRMGSVEPPRLELNVLENHLRKAIHWTSFAEPMRDVYRFIRHDTIKKSISNYVGVSHYRQAVPLLQALARDGRPIGNEALRDAESWLSRLRTNGTVAYIGAKATTAIVQPSALLPALGEVPAPVLLGALKDFICHPINMTRSVAERSAFLKRRSMNFDRDVREAFQSFKVSKYSLRLGGNLITGEQVRDAYFVATRTFDVLAASIVFEAAYRDGMKKYASTLSEKYHPSEVLAEEQAKTERFAKEYAESVVRRTQGDGNLFSQPAIMRGNAAYRLFTMFYSYQNAMGNRLWENFNRAKEGNISWLKFSEKMSYDFIIPAIFTGLILNFMHDRENDPIGMLYNIVSSPVATIPFVRDLGSAALSEMITGKSFGYKGTPAMDFGVEAVWALHSLGRIANGHNTAEEFEKFMKHSTMVGGFMYGIPSRQIWITYEGARDLATGKTKDPRRLLFAGKKD
jgi:hypothetical protein